MNEVKDFHPLVEQWLIENGYTFRHHVRLEDGIADYIAERNGETIVIECKSDGSASSAKNGRFFAQVLDYARQVPNSKPCAAMPSYLVTDKTREICEYYGIRLIVIECERIENDSDSSKGFCLAALIQWQRMDFMDSINDNIDTILKEIIDDADNLQSAILNMLILLKLLDSSMWRNTHDDTFQKIAYRQFAILYLANDGIEYKPTVENGKEPSK